MHGSSSSSTREGQSGCPLSTQSGHSGTLSNAPSPDVSRLGRPMCYVQRGGRGGCVFIRKLRPGERAPDKADRIHINRLGDGRISWTGSVYARGKTVLGTGPAEFATIQE